MVGMLLSGDLEAVHTCVVVGALAALVTGASDHNIAEIAEGVVDGDHRRLMRRFRSRLRSVPLAAAIALEHGVNDNPTRLVDLEEFVEWIVVLRSVLFLDAASAQIVVCSVSV